MTNNTGLFIDGAHLYAAARTIGLDIDFKRLLAEFRSRGPLVRAYFYLAIIEDQDAPRTPAADRLAQRERFYRRHQGGHRVHRRQRPAQGCMDVELTLDAVELADRISQMVLFSDSGNLRALVGAMQRRGVKVTVISTHSTRSGLIADELRHHADRFIDLVDLKEKLCRDPTEHSRPMMARNPRQTIQ
jgi:uncharacterized LabA/DUF88 family protein